MQNVFHVTIIVETEVCNEKNWVFFTSKDPSMFFDKEGMALQKRKLLHFQRSSLPKILHFQRSSLPKILRCSLIRRGWLCRRENCFICVCSQSLQLCPTLRSTHELQPAGLLCPWNSTGKNAGVGGHILLQRIFPTQALNLRLLNCRWIFYC